ncbi:MAG: hypothetical protein JRI54_12085, partial [Deltaproteobacteria bacterium]|nr:hypothetical protein [Deltaproteobacteria bacterium]
RGGIGYNPNVPFYEYNPEKARKLLLEAGYPNGFKTKFYVSSDPQPYVEAMLQQWRDIGIQIQRVQVSGPVVKKKIIKKTLDGMVGWGAGFGGHDPAATWLQNCVSYKGTWAVHGKNEQVETLVKKQAAEFDQVKRGRIIDEIIQILWRDAWFVPLWESVHIQAIRAEWNYKQMPTQRIIYFSSLSKKR